MRTFLITEVDTYFSSSSDTVYGTDNLVADMEGRFSNAEETTPPKFWDLVSEKVSRFGHSYKTGGSITITELIRTS